MDNNKIKPCRTCSKDVATSAKTCPHCGEKLPTIDVDRRKKINKRILLSFLGFLVFISVIDGLGSKGQEVQLPPLDHLQPEAKALLLTTWPKIKEVFPGLKKYGQDLKIVEISENMFDYSKPLDEYNNHLVVVLAVSEGQSKIPSSYRAWGNNCFLDIYPQDMTVRISKTACKSVFLDRVVEYDNGNSLVLTLP